MLKKNSWRTGVLAHDLCHTTFKIVKLHHESTARHHETQCHVQA